ncbi:MAG: DUF2852 domain-containing protein, partial [Halocynthiibacter sp.]
IWSNRMFSGTCARRSHSNFRTRQRDTFRKSGNSAFDAYKSDTLRRLQEEQENFEAFLKRLRDSKDKSEFDAFMDERAKAARAGQTEIDDDTPIEV